jgi:hypothetical protein
MDVPERLGWNKVQIIAPDGLNHLLGFQFTVRARCSLLDLPD